MLTDGKKVSQISDLLNLNLNLNLNPKTVYSYRYRIFEKLGIRSDVELTILAQSTVIAIVSSKSWASEAMLNSPSSPSSMASPTTGVNSNNCQLYRANSPT